jgi:hypothetical protein
MNAAVSTLLAKPEGSDDNELDGMPHIPKAVKSPILIEPLVREYREILKNGRGAGVMLGFDVVRVDWRDALLAYQRSTRSAARSSGLVSHKNKTLSFSQASDPFQLIGKRGTTD